MFLETNSMLVSILSKVELIYNYFNIKLCAHRTEFNYHYRVSIEIEFRLRVDISAVSPHC